MTDHERIFISAGRCFSDRSLGPNDTEYVRADLFDHLQEEINRLDVIVHEVGEDASTVDAAIADIRQQASIIKQLHARLVSQQDLLDKWPRVFFTSLDPRSATTGHRVVSVEADTSGDTDFIGIMMDVDGEEIYAPDDFGLYFSREALEAAEKEKE